MQIISEAVIFYLLAFGAVYWVLWSLYKDLRGRIVLMRIAEKREKIGVMDTILVIEAIAILIYTAVDFWIFYRVGSEPSTLTMSFFAVCGGENGFMAWIKTRKEQERMRRWQNEDERNMDKSVEERDPYKEDDGL